MEKKAEGRNASKGPTGGGWRRVPLSSRNTFGGFPCYNMACFLGIRNIESTGEVEVCVCISFITLNPFRTAVPFWGQTSQISSSLSLKRDCGSKGVNTTKVQVA